MSCLFRNNILFSVRHKCWLALKCSQCSALPSRGRNTCFEKYEPPSQTQGKSPPAKLVLFLANAYFISTPPSPKKHRKRSMNKMIKVNLRLSSTGGAKRTSVRKATRLYSPGPLGWSRLSNDSSVMSAPAMGTSKTAHDSSSKKKKGPGTLATAYLVIYNVVMTAGYVKDPMRFRALCSSENESISVSVLIVLLCFYPF